LAALANPHTTAVPFAVIKDAQPGLAPAWAPKTTGGFFMFIRQLAYLVTLARERHFGRAAEACNVSQPALSGAIRSIERELGMSIVRRGRRFEGFTPHGEQVLAWARRVVADCEGLRQAATEDDEGPSGVLRLGAIPTTVAVV